MKASLKGRRVGQGSCGWSGCYPASLCVLGLPRAQWGRTGGPTMCDKLSALALGRLYFCCLLVVVAWEIWRVVGGFGPEASYYALALMEGGWSYRPSSAGDAEVSAGRVPSREEN